MLEGSTVLLIRHGEKTGDPCAKDTQGQVDLSPYGQERAQAYVQYFENYAATSTGGGQPQAIKLDYLFASANSPSSYRPVETLTPLATATNLPFDTQTKDADYGDLVTQVLPDPKYAGAGILICWHHGTIVKFANQLLSVNNQQTKLPPASTWPESYDCCTFGWLFQIRYDSGGIVMPQWTRCLNEHLMSDDTIDPPGAVPALRPQSA